MKAKTKKHLLRSFLQSNGISAIAVVILCGSLGSQLLPHIFAATVYKVTRVTATPSNTSAYSIQLTWDGTTPDHWQGQTLRDGTLVDTWQDKNKARNPLNLKCGSVYTFKVAASGPNDGAQSDFVSAQATTACPSVKWDSFTASGNSVSAVWHNGGSFNETYNYYIKAGSGGYAASSTTATSRIITGSCGTTYSAYLTATANGQTGAPTFVRSVATAACPSAPKPAPAPAPIPKPAAPSSTKTTTKSTSKAKAATTPSSTAAGSTTAPLAPSTPENFSAEIVSQKVVTLNWDTADNADHYVINRSTDNAAFTQLTTTTDTTFRDTTTDFNTTYYYQLQAVGSDGQVSDVVTAQASTDSFSASSNSITSTDKLVSAKIPDGAIEGDYYCTITGDEEHMLATPAGQKTLLGPYDLLCVTEAGDIINNFEAPISLTMKLASVAKGYDSLTARSAGSNSWKTLPVKLDRSKQQLSFELTNSKTFAAFGVKHKSPVGMILFILFMVLLGAAAIVGFLFWRRRRQAPAAVTTAQTQLNAQQEFRQALAKPDCSHRDLAQQVTPSSQGCYECLQQGTEWKSLRICLICGHVGCSDDSEQQHALRHFHETGHPLIYDYANPTGSSNSIGWCYIDQTYI